MSTNAIETNVENVEVIEKPYEFRELCAKDITLMTSVIKAIGLKEFKKVLNEDVLEKIVEMFNRNNAVTDDENNVVTDDENTEVQADVVTDDENTLTAIGLSMLPSVFDIAEIILDNIEKCQTALNKLLARTSNLSVEKVENLSLATYAEMIFDFIKKDEFPDFFKVVSKSFKLGN